MSKAKNVQYLITLLGAALGYFLSTYAYAINPLTHIVPQNIFVGISVLTAACASNMSGRTIAYGIDPLVFDELAE